MLPDQLLSFLAISLLFILIPGPNVLVIVATSLVSGRTRGMQTVVGTSLAMLLQLGVAALATGSLLLLLNKGLAWLKWLGVCYLIFLGIRSLYQCWLPGSTGAVSALGSFQRGFWVSLTNPKTIFFFSAFLPQFVSDAEYYLPQIGFLSICFWILATVCDCGYALLAGKLDWLLAPGKSGVVRFQNGLSGTLYLVASGFLANSNRA